MCGRLNVIDDPLAQAVSATLGITFYPRTNRDLRPTENVSVIGTEGYSLTQLELLWGIKPDWAKKVIINAQAESVASKPTFRSAFRHHRVIVPVNGWYEWKGEKGKKDKYLFSDPECQPLFIAGIALEQSGHLVTLTTQPNSQYAQYHHRMPLLFDSDQLELWLHGGVEDAGQLLSRIYNRELIAEIEH